MKDVTRNYLFKADHDLGSAEIIYKNKPEFTDTITFHAQQTIEKVLKAYLNFHNQKIHAKHDISALLKNCREIDSEFSKFIIPNTANLNEIGMSIRYSDSDEDPGKEEAFQFLELAKDIREFVLSKLSQNGFEY